jgi:hypothetical protein
LTLKDGGECSSETSVDFQQTTWRYISEDRTFQEASYLGLLGFSALFIIEYSEGIRSLRNWTCFQERDGK